MSVCSYRYQNREDVLPISWNDFHGICKALAKSVSGYQPEIILAIGRGGFYPGTLLAHLLQVEMYPIRLSRRVNDIVEYEQPQWLLEPPQLIRKKAVLIVDEICDSGETLKLVQEKTFELGARSMKSAVLYSHSWKATVPDYIGVITDALILNPWDREILKDGEFEFHPEYLGALESQGLKPDSKLLIDATRFRLAKEE
jgi:hypoxanthine phosphoribosyltransferase